jgi:hypothetical protein
MRRCSDHRANASKSNRDIPLNLLLRQNLSLTAITGEAERATFFIRLDAP